MLFLTAEDASAQAGDLVISFPCQNVKKTPDSFKELMKWAHRQAGPQLTVKSSSDKDSIWAAIQFRSFHLKKLNRFYNSRKKVVGLADGELKISGTCREPKITGKITLTKGFVQIINFGSSSLQSVEVDTITFAETLNMIKALQLDIDIDVGNDFNIRSEQYLSLKVVLSGALNLSKNAGQRLQLTGKLKASGGYIKPLGKRFRVAEGLLTYDGKANDPEVYLKSVYQPHRDEQDVKIWYIVEGRMQEPAFKFKSEPFMESQNIFSYTLFGQPFYQLTSIEQNLIKTIASQSSADRTSEVLLSRAEKIVTQKLSVDVVRIDNTTGKSGTVITTGWYLKPRVFFAIQNIIAGKPQLGFYLEY
ncbi:MAG TPA: translocation/assembly module TamB domain-containing protein, partial [Balneolaceae bacterium]|nr:translocation/assembly module TamB domain-containing protein [Balneolaceae bacterium]